MKLHNLLEEQQLSRTDIDLFRLAARSSHAVVSYLSTRLHVSSAYPLPNISVRQCPTIFVSHPPAAIQYL